MAMMEEINWKAAAGEVAKYAPAVASILAGPSAGGITQGAVDMVAGLLGINADPDSFIAATKNPEQAAELQRIDREHRRELVRMRLEAQTAAAQETTKRLADVNATYRLELQSDSRVNKWRSVLGWVFVLACFGVMSSIVWSMFQAGSDKDALLGNALVMFGIIGAVLGIDINRVGKERLASMGQQQPMSFMDAVKTRVAK